MIKWIDACTEEVKTATKTIFKKFGSGEVVILIYGENMQKFVFNSNL